MLRQVQRHSKLVAHRFGLRSCGSGRSVGNSRQMTTSEQISEICDTIVREFKPERIIVFGSHAYGNPGPFSDLDLLTCYP